MPLVSLEAISLAYGAQPLLDQASLTIERTERSCLLGRNGAGKSTLLRILAGEIEPDAGAVRWDDTARVALLPQDVPPGLQGSVRDVVAGGLGELGALLTEYSERAAVADPDLQTLERLQRRIDAAGGWDLEGRIERTLSRVQLPADQDFQALSGGLARRALLARALVTEPALLLLDEPTNHLDIDAIAWLEALLASWGGSLLFTTHDRRFLQRLATRIIELDRGVLSSWPGDYAEYLRRREERLAAEARERERFDRRLAAEESWVRQGIKARRTRNEGRVRHLQAMRAERRQRREQTGRARFDTQSALASGRRVIEANDASFAWRGDMHEPLVHDLSTLIERGDKIGIVGSNGSGKTTLLRLLLGELAPSGGRIRHGTRLEIAYFDQHRAVLDEATRVVDAVADGTDFIEVNGARRHVMGYLQDFLFTPWRARQPVGSLSGGERARLLLARLFAKPSNVLVLDEPTNDLDIETLELLEERLLDYPGTVLLVSHDREFLDNVVTATLVLEGGGRVGEYVGGYADWLRQRPSAEPSAARQEPAPASSAGCGERRTAPARKLGYREQRELAELPGRIEALETELERLQAQLADPNLYQNETGDRIAELKQALTTQEAALQAAYTRWEALEE